MRIKDLPLAQTLTGDEFLAVDDATSGTKKASIDDVLSGIQETLDSLPEDDNFASALITERTLDNSVSSADLLMVVDPVTRNVRKKTIKTLTSILAADITAIEEDISDLQAADTTLQGNIDAVAAYEPIRIDIASFQTLPQTVTNAAITADMVVLGYWFSRPSSQTSEWTVTTSNGSLTVSGGSGAINGWTALTLILGKANV